MIRKILVVTIVLFALYFILIFNDQDDNSGRFDYKSAVKLEIPPEYYEINFKNKDTQCESDQIAKFFLQAIHEKPKRQQLALQIRKGPQSLLYLCDLPKNTFQKREIHSSGTIMEDTWRGNVLQRLSYAAQNNSFTPPGMALAESRNLYH